MRFPPEFIERVLENSNIVEIIGAHTQLKSSGSQYMGLCPFPDHVESSPSFSVSETKQVYHCFGCLKSGNAFTFLQTYNGMNFPEAVEYLARKANLSLPQPESQQEASKEAELREKRQKILRVNRIAANFFHQHLLQQAPQAEIWDYLQTRGLDRSLIEQFQIGLAPETWDSLTQALQKQLIPLDLAEEAKLVRAKSGGGFYDLFRHRLMFPIESALGDIIGFGGRVLKKEDQPKYLNSPETLVFHKSKVLYGIKEAAKYARSANQLIVVEGYMDCIALHKAGFKNAVATLGTALTAEHGRALAKITKNIVVLFDGDEAGQNAAERSLPLLLAADLHAKGLTLPDELDPDEFLKSHGTEALQSRIEQAPDLFHLITSRWLEGYKGEAFQKVNFVDKVKPLLESIPDSRLREIYIQDLANKLSVNTAWLKESFHRKSAPVPYKSPELKKEVPTRQEQNLGPVNPSEAWLLSLCLKNRANLDEFILSHGLQYLNHDSIKNLFEFLVSHYRQHPDSFDKLTNLCASMIAEKGENLRDERQRDLNSLMFLAWELKSEAEEHKLFKDAFKKNKTHFLEKQIESLRNKIKTSASSPEDLLKIAELQKEKIKLSQSSV